MKRTVEKIKNKVISNALVVENYFFMTAIQLINSLFGIAIYPYLIRVLGADSYGLYAFALSVTSYFTSFISFGFNFPGVKAIAQNKNNPEIKRVTVSAILTAKIYLGLLSILIFLILTYYVPLMHSNKRLFALGFIQIIAEIIFPVWYFQGIQRMKIVTYIQLGFRILSLPFIVIFIHRPGDVWIYMLIGSCTVISGAITAIIYLIKIEKIGINLLPFKSLIVYYKDALPFFWSSSAGTIKEETVTMIIGSLFGMRDVAYYDLAKKIIILPRMLTMSINNAIFPKFIENVQKSTVKKIVRYETIIGFAISAFIIFTGYWLVLFLGGIEMLPAYPMSIILSFTILVWLVVGSYISFIFVPANKYYFVTRNQLVALLSFLLFCIPGLFIYHHIWTIIIALTLSGFSEILYCRYLIHKHKML